MTQNLSSLKAQCLLDELVIFKTKSVAFHETICRRWFSLEHGAFAEASACRLFQLAERVKTYLSSVP